MVKYVENLPEPYDADKFRVTSSLYTELSILSDSGQGKFVLLKPCATELNDALFDQAKYNWNEERLLLKNVPIDDESLILRVKVVRFFVRDKKNQHEEICKRDMPLSYLFEGLLLKPWQYFSPIAVPRER